jgi:putative NADH-flavin reductase
MKLAIIGASGWLGGEIAREALTRGHLVTAIGRDRDRLTAIADATAVEADVRDRDALRRAIADHDVVVTAISERSSDDRSIIPSTTRLLLAIAPTVGVRRLAFVGGGGSLELDDGRRFVDLADFPDEYRAEALAQAESLQLLREHAGSIDWTYLSPPPAHLERGPARGGFRVQAGERPVRDVEGDSQISSGDLAAAMLDELEHPRFSKQRFTVGY